MKIVPKAKEAPISPKAEAKAKAFKNKKAMLKSLHSQSKKNLHITHLPTAQGTAALKVAQISSEEHSQQKQALPLCHH